MTDDVLIQTEGKAGRIRLNRPKAIHALNTGMCAAMLEALAAWHDDPAIGIVLVDHAEGRGFCAGGDIRMIAESGASDGVAAREFFRTEYQLNHAMFTCEKPIVAFMDGITMGGGVGISQPAKYRVATENTKFAMPETGIGLFPDVGGGWYLSRLPGKTGEYLALTGHRLDGAECVALGLASHYLPAEALEEAKARIAGDPAAVEAILAELAIPAPEPPIAAHREAIDRLFAADTVEGVFSALEADGGEWAAAQLATLRTKSPQSMKVSLRLVREGRAKASFADEMAQEYAIGGRVAQSHDFIEGVRALIVDKDNAPQWKPATLEGVSDAMLDAIFAPLPEGEAWAPL
ncbi:enoyl-CoA hydratase/isomerase family protein [Sphingomonas sp. NIBR02145]|uniref:enoyl-CoA hydratase/isomerase family protein n=1 Tax=Sphingomonas sp. NIBR02145 TaxID=3014784 RepID=UPI0022B3ED6A|nr:enoyl-CoA hydratase/isomerase family protein [Sphingomonas sp. NIBR02145]WHU02756.1 enoyl-CoA hydratase/isomerase family protein [Sphingomonas sp. NIBR02145]